jgi:hypothetical protein
MKTKIRILTMLAMCVLVLAPASLLQAGSLPTPHPEKAGCYSMDGKTYYKCGQSWTDSYNGVVYDCRCNCPPIAGGD